MERGEVEETRALQSSVILTWSGMKYQLRRQQKLLLLRLLLLMCTQVHPQSVFVGGSIYLLGTSSAPVLTGCNYERPPSSQCRPAARLFFFKQNAAFFFLILYFTSRLNPTRTHEGGEGGGGMLRGTFETKTTTTTTSSQGERPNENKSFSFLSLKSEGGKMRL